MHVTVLSSNSFARVSSGEDEAESHLLARGAIKRLQVLQGKRSGAHIVGHGHWIKTDK